jgi:hypothetical protein
MVENIQPLKWRAPRNPKNLHRPLSAGDYLTDVFAWREKRTVSNSLTLQYDKVVFLLEPNAITHELRRKRVTVVDYPDGRLAIRYRGSTCHTPPSTSCGSFRRPPSSRTSTSAPSSRRSASASSNAPRLAASPHHAARGRDPQDGAAMVANQPAREADQDRVSHRRYVTFQMAEVAMPRQMFAEILSLIARLRAPPAPV